MGVTIAVAQSQPNLENGFKHYGSYDFHGIDTVNTMNGNLMLHSPLVPDYPQRAKLTPHYNLYVTSKNWQVRCVPNTDGGEFCFWASGGTGIVMQSSLGVTLHRTYNKFGSGTGTVSYGATAYSLTSADGATHQLYPLPGTADSQGEAIKFEAIDTSGYHLEMSGPDSNGVLSTFTVTDRQSNQYTGTFTGGFAPGSCGRPQTNQMQPPGAYAPAVDDSPLGDQYCSQFAISQQVSDSNGNQITFIGSNSPGGLPNTWTDTLGRTAPLNTGAAGDFSGCVSPFTLVRADTRYYRTPDGSTQVIKLCYANVPVETAFNQAGVVEAQSAGSAYATSQLQQVVTVILADGSRWSFNYDSYGELASVGLPTGGSISYTWTTIGYPNCTGTDQTRFSRAVATRTVNDNRGQVSSWQYAWGNPTSTTMVNTVTDAVSNDTVHTFTALDTQSNGSGGCGFYETRTQLYQGSGSARQLLKQVDTSYAHTFLAIDDGLTGLSLGNVGASRIQTTLYPSGKVSLVTREYDAGLGTNAPNFGNVTVQKEYDWGPGQPGPLLRETDTTYQWQVDSRYLTAHLLDLPASVIIKDGSGCVVARTTFGYDESGYLQTYTRTLPAGTHGSPPYSVRGNQTSVNRYLWNLTTGSCAAVPAQPAVVSHATWYDTGELYQQIDPLGHTTTHSYDPTYAGAYSTQTCNALNQCVSGTYDFNTGLLTSFTDANGSSMASGNTPGDAAHTSNYSYDFMFRLVSALAPPDPNNNGSRSQTSFQYSPATSFPLSVQRQKSITSTMNDVSTAYFDGLARPYQAQHITPSGTAKVDTVYDAIDQVASVSNPYFTSSDSTYGVVQSTYDALGRVKRTQKQDNSISAADYSDGNCTTTTDEAGKQRRACSDALGRLVSVDEPGDTNAGASSVSTGGTQASATVTITGTEQSVTVPAPGGSTPQRCHPGLVCDASGGSDGSSGPGTITTFDSGTVSITINQHTYSVAFGMNDTITTIAANLAGAINADISLGVTASSSAGAVSLTSVSASSAGSFTVTTSWTWDTTDFAQPSFRAAVTSISGGTDGSAVFGGHAYTTLYSYNGLSNLVQVTQQGGSSNQALWRVRVFTYDSLSRLLTANNPESGLISYGYDIDGNLISKTDARGIAVNYSPADSPIDALHRVTKKTFSNGDAPELFTYDSYSGFNGGSSSGRLIRAYKNGSHWFTYDVLGRVTSTWQCLPSNCSSGASISAGFDLAGNLTALTYPSGRTVSFNYNSGNQLNRVQFTRWTQPGSPALTPYSYWSASDNNFSPTGAPNVWTLGNGVTESALLNQRLQLQQETVSNPGIHTLMDRVFNYGAQNNGNILSVADQLNPARTQAFSYDALNRLATANESGGRWGLSFGYDPWGNRLQQNVTAGVAGTSQMTVDAHNRVQGAPVNCTSGNEYCYDLAGNMLNDGFHQYNYNADNKITQVDGAAATYTYDAEGQRLRKDTPGGSTEYIYFGGNAIAEKNVQTGDWTDYIFANGKRIAQAFSYENRIRVYGTSSCTSCAGQWAFFALPNSNGLNGYVLKAGDRLFLRQTTAGNVHVGIGLNFTNGTDSWGLTDQDGQGISNDNLGLNGSWHSRNIDLSTMQGKTVSMVYLYVIPTGSGNWSGYFNDLSLVSADGTIYPLYSQQNTVNFSLMDSSQAISGINYEVNRDAFAAPYAFSAHYYHGDQIGSARLMTSGGGWPIWQGTFLPFGEEYSPQISTNNYKYSDKERDSESGLDYFGKRYYANSLGRWTSPDPINFSKKHLASPQRWNRYSYVQNDPLGKIDPDGLDDFVIFRPGATETNKRWAAAKSAAEKNPANHVAILNGPDATVKAWEKARTTPGTTLIFAGGHTTHENNADGTIGKTTAVTLNLGKSAGEKGFESYAIRPASNPAEPPMITNESSMVVSPGPTQADTVAIFGCQSIDLVDQYGNASFIGLSSGLDKLSSVEALDEAGAAFLEAAGTGQDAVHSAQEAFDKNARVNEDVNDKDGDKVVKADKKKPE